MEVTERLRRLLDLASDLGYRVCEVSVGDVRLVLEREPPEAPSAGEVTDEAAVIAEVLR